MRDVFYADDVDWTIHADGSATYKTPGQLWAKVQDYVATAEKKARGQVVDYIEKVASEEEEWFCVRQTHLDEARELGGEKE